MAISRVYAPNKEYYGFSAGVYFVAGVAETDNENALNYFRNAGYEIIEEAPAENPAGDPPADPPADPPLDPAAPGEESKEDPAAEKGKKNK